MNELDLQREIVRDAREAGGFAMKMSHRFMVGVPDLLIKMPETAVFLVECKRHEQPKRVRFIDPNLTLLQLSTLRDFKRAGGEVAAFHFILNGSEKWCYVVGAADLQKGIDLQDRGCAVEKRRKRPWPVSWMLRLALHGPISLAPC